MAEENDNQPRQEISGEFPDSDWPFPDELRKHYKAVMLQAAHPDSRPTVDNAVNAALAVESGEMADMLVADEESRQDLERVQKENARLRMELEHYKGLYAAQHEVFTAPLPVPGEPDKGLQAIERLNDLLRVMDEAAEENRDD